MSLGQYYYNGFKHSNPEIIKEFFVKEIKWLTNYLAPVTYKLKIPKYLMDDIWGRAYERIMERIEDGTYTEKGKFKQYFGILAYNICYEIHRELNPQKKDKSGKSFSRFIDLKDGVTEEMRSNSDAVFSEDSQDFIKEKVSKVRAIIATFPESWQEMIPYRFEFGWSYEAIGAHFGKSQGSVKVTFHNIN